MHGDEDSQTPSAVSLLPMAVVALAVLVLALVVSGSRTGTIVVQRTMFSSAAIQNGHANPRFRFEDVLITQTSADGTEQRYLTTNSLARPGFQAVSAGQRIELYDPLNDTIYRTSQNALQRAQFRRIALVDPNAKHTISASGRGEMVFAGPTMIPGRTSVYEAGLRAGQYRRAGMTVIDGHTALRLVQTRTSQRFGAGGMSLPYHPLSTVYVSPRSYVPILEITHISLPGATSTVTQRWQTYRVLSASRANERLLSLTALHPHARVIDNANSYLRATQSEQRPPHVVRTGSTETIAAASGG